MPFQNGAPSSRETFIMTLTKKAIVHSVANRSDLPDAQASKTVEATLEIIKKTLESGEDVLISGFGKLCVKNKDKRKGRNPSTGNNILLDARRVVIFKCSSLFKGKLNGKA
jgi:integration host factor subunit alpha